MDRLQSRTDSIEGSPAIFEAAGTVPRDGNFGEHRDREGSHGDLHGYLSTGWDEGRRGWSWKVCGWRLEGIEVQEKSTAGFVGSDWIH
jgi:hypothetical protein